MTGRRFFLDANVLLNAVFLPTSMSRQAVNLLSHNASKIFTCTTTVDEAKRVATNLSQRHCQWFEAKEAIDAFLIRNTVEILAGVPIKTGRAHDNHVVSGATTAAATLVTLDSELQLSCISSGVNTKSSLDVIREFSGWKLQTTCFGIPPRPSSGYVFVRATPGDWGGRAREGRFTVADFPGAMTISYNAQFSA